MSECLANNDMVYQLTFIPWVHPAPSPGRSEDSATTGITGTLPHSICATVPARS